MTETKKMVLSMLLENTGVAMLDSGGDDGRMWQRNAKKDLTKEPQVTIDDITEPTASEDIDINVSLYHYLPEVLELDAVCDLFNTGFAKMADWESDIYGVSKEAEAWLKRKGFTTGDSWNSYNGESNLSQTLQGTELKIDGLGEGEYVLLQVHGGADVRGGYTDAKLFHYQKFQEFIDPCPRVYATLTRKDGSTVELESRDSGYGFVTVDGESITVEPSDIIEASI